MKNKQVRSSRKLEAPKRQYLFSRATRRLRIMQNGKLVTLVTTGDKPPTAIRATSEISSYPRKEHRAQWKSKTTWETIEGAGGGAVQGRSKRYTQTHNHPCVVKPDHHVRTKLVTTAKLSQIKPAVHFRLTIFCYFYLLKINPPLIVSSLFSIKRK